MPEARVGPYRLLRRIATGGMGTVWVGRCDPNGPLPSDLEVAVKVVKPGGDEERVRFAREARYLQGLHHPGIVRVLDTGEDAEQAWLVMPLIEGRRLDELGHTTPLKAAALVVQALEALHVAHLAGILHRDIKPGNLMLDRRERVLLLDFGLAAAPDLESRLTRDGDVVGTPAYMAPEQASGAREQIGRQTDLYAMGAVLYELVTGRQPHAGDNTMATLRAVIEERLISPRELRPDLPRPLERIILMAMAKDPRDRYRTAEDMAEDLRRWMAGRRVRAAPPGVLRLGLRSAYRHRRVLAASTLAAFVLTSGTVLGVRTLVARQAPPVVPASAWVTEADLAVGTIAWRSHAPLGADLAELPPVAGPVRLTIQTTAPEPGGWTELLVADRDVANGYRLRLEDGNLRLLREDRTMAQQAISGLTPRTPVTLTLTNDEGALSAVVVWDQGTAELSFDDLVPLQGPDADGVWVAVPAGAPRPNAITLERRQTGEFVSALARADLLRQDRRYARAQALYERFLRDQPDSPQARDARLRLALCLEAQGDRERALKEYLGLAAEQGTDPRYALVATFHAWTCALAMGRYVEADQYFSRIRTRYELPALAAAIPQSTLRDLRRDYQARATRLAAEDPERTLGLLFTAAELASFLGEDLVQAEVLTSAGDLLLALDRPGVARETWRRCLGIPGLDRLHRLDLLIRTAVACRLAEDADSAALALAQAVPLAKDADENRRLALWQGDLLAERGENAQALATWRAAADAASPLGRLLGHLADLNPPRVEDPLVARVPEGAWIAGRAALLGGDTDAALAWLGRAGADPLRWPGSLARLQARQLGAP